MTGLEQESVIDMEGVLILSLGTDFTLLSTHNQVGS